MSKEEKKEEERAKPTTEELDQIAEHAKKEREEAVKKVLERKVFLADKYVKPHNKKSRKVTEEDLDRVLEDAPIMHEMCLVGRGDYTTAYAIAHPQINDEDPLAFYVTFEGQIVINPHIINHTRHFVDKREGCMSYPEEPMKTVLRYNKVTARYQTVVTNVEKDEKGEDKTVYKLSPDVETKYEGAEAQVVQHECSHLLGHNIYDEGYSGDKAIETKIILE
jgi:peptide deformylase